MNSPTKWTLYTSNEEAWAAMLEDCAHATKSIALEQFIFVNDDFGNRLIEVCTERAAAGVDIRFLWDAGGSFTFFGSNIAEDLRKKHIKLLFWKTLIPGYFKVPNIRSWFLRNHRRTLVIDEKIGYTGSMCVKDSYRDWRDTNARFEGTVVEQMQNAFDRMWARADDKKHLPFRVTHRDTEFEYVTNNPTPGKRHLYRRLVDAIRNAEHYVYLTTPYFVPTQRLARVIKLAAHRGVDVRLIIPDRTNHFLALDLGAMSFFSTLLESGVRIFLYPSNGGETLIHSKAGIIDGEWSTIGSLNLDHVSLLYNFEANIVSSNSKFAEELAAHFVRDMNICKEVNAAEWHDRFFLEKLPEYAIKLVRKFL
ncbi:MAG: phospholipase D-like domain-containing protein [Candidatus Taylorbacteria bacterium]|nr:phospholipase D-like domain-containing protein [Candidatus Taylorbacteria bacterium]